MSGRRDCIVDRIDAALEKMAARGWAVRAIYLDDEDRAALDAWATKEWRKGGSEARAHPLSFRDHLIVGAALAIEHFRDHELRTGKRSAVYSDRGCQLAVPRQLSRRTEAAA